MKLIFAVDSMSIVRWWVDASDNNHKYFKGRTGSMRSLGKGLVVSYSRRKYDKLNRNRISAAYYLIPIFGMSFMILVMDGIHLPTSLLLMLHVESVLY